MTRLLAVLVLAGCASLHPKRQPVVFVLHNCQPTEQVQVVIAGPDGKPKESHEELSCLCANKSEKIDAKSGRLVIECQ